MNQSESSQRRRRDDAETSIQDARTTFHGGDRWSAGATRDDDDGRRRGTWRVISVDLETSTLHGVEWRFASGHCTMESIRSIIQTIDVRSMSMHVLHMGINRVPQDLKHQRNKEGKKEDRQTVEQSGGILVSGGYVIRASGSFPGTTKPTIL